MTAAATDDIPVRYEVGDREVVLDALSRKDRRRLESVSEKFRKKYKNVVDDNGNRPTLVIKQANRLVPMTTAILEFPESMKSIIEGSEEAVRVS